MSVFEDPRDERDLESVLSKRVARSPDKPWLVTDDGSWSYGDIDTRAGRLARGFAQAGVAAGDTVLLMLPDTVDYICLWCALAKIGAIEVPVNVHHRGSILSWLINDSQAEVLVVDAQFLERFEVVADGLDTLKRMYVVGAANHAIDVDTELIDWRELSSSDREWAGEGPSHVDLMAVMYTSGTTGPSKGATITHAHAYQYAQGVVRMLELNESDIYYAPLPLFHIAGQFALVYAACIAGATAVLPGTFSARRFWRDVRRHNATATFLLGAMANFLYRQDPAQDDANNPLERVLMVPLIPQTEEFKTRFDCMVSTTWGGTEMNCPVRSGFDLVGSRSCGRLIEDLYEVRIVDHPDPRGGRGARALARRGGAIRGPAPVIRSRHRGCSPRGAQGGTPAEGPVRRAAPGSAPSILGSASPELIRGDSESLAGRVEFIVLAPDAGLGMLRSRPQRRARQIFPGVPLRRVAPNNPRAAARHPGVCSARRRWGKAGGVVPGRQ